MSLSSWLNEDVQFLKPRAPASAPIAAPVTPTRGGWDADGDPRMGWAMHSGPVPSEAISSGAAPATPAAPVNHTRDWHGRTPAESRRYVRRFYGVSAGIVVGAFVLAILCMALEWAHMTPAQRAYKTAFDSCVSFAQQHGIDSPGMRRICVDRAKIVAGNAGH